MSDDMIQTDEVLVPFPFGMIYKDTELVHFLHDRMQTDRVPVPLSDDIVYKDTELVPLSDDMDTFSYRKDHSDWVLVCKSGDMIPFSS